MRNIIAYPTLGLALVAGMSVAQAQSVETVIAPQPGVIVTGPVTQPLQTAPVETVETVRTVRSTPAARVVSRKVVHTRSGNTVTTTRTIVREAVISAPAPIAAAPAVQAMTRPAYTEIVQGPAVTTVPAYPRLYDVVTPAPIAAPAVMAPATVTIGDAPMVPAYRYVYQPDRILLIDTNTGIAVQAIPR